MPRAVNLGGLLLTTLAVLDADNPLGDAETLNIASFYCTSSSSTINTSVGAWNPAS